MEQQRSEFPGKAKDQERADKEPQSNAKHDVPSNGSSDVNDLPLIKDQHQNDLSPDVDDDELSMDDDPPRLMDEPFYDEQRDEEFASELTEAPGINTLSKRTFGDMEADPDLGDVSRFIGWTALAMAIVSLFVWPVFFGTVATVTGAIAWMRGSRILGIWSVTLGLISIVLYLFLAPFNGA